MAAWVWILIAIGVIVIVGLVFAFNRQHRSDGLRQHFGAEYDRAIEAQPNRRAAESDLRDRAKRRSSIEVHALTESSLHRYAAEWSTVQAQFVDQPTEAVRSADGLVHRVMNERGYPMENFDHEADLISVDHPDVVDNFRSAHNVFLRAQAQQASTEDLRSAMLHYRSLFDQLLVSDAPFPGDDTGDDQMEGRGERVTTQTTAADGTTERPRP